MRPKVKAENSSAVRGAEFKKVTALLSAAWKELPAEQRLINKAVSQQKWDEFQAAAHRDEMEEINL